MDPSRLSSYGFVLPPDRIATQPPLRRSDARMLVVKKNASSCEHRGVRDLVDELSAGDVLVVNDTTVIPARLLGEKDSGGKVECLLVRVHDADSATWVCLLNCSKKPKPEQRLSFVGATATNGMTLSAVVGEGVPSEAGAYLVRFLGDVLAFARAHGHVPLPPYMNRADTPADRDRYQTVFHDDNKPGSSAAPTAGLHFDAEMLDALAHKGVQRVAVTLHVGPGTFMPVRDDNLDTHVMHPEPWWVSNAAADAVNSARDRGNRVVAVGTTSLRALESSVDVDGRVRSGAGLTRLFVRPGARIRSVDAIVTNFHLPHSTLFVLVCAAIGIERARAAYDEAIAHGYRFYSYGDTSYLEVIDDAVMRVPR